MSWYSPTSTSTTQFITTTTTASSTGWINAGAITGTSIVGYSPQYVDYPSTKSLLTLDRDYELPDGSILKIDRLGNYRVDDSRAKVTYRANRVREFNPYINASDLLEHFIKEVGVLDAVDQSEVLRLPIEAFINWLILQAAKRDGDSLDNLPSVESALPVLALPNPNPVRSQPQCGTCGRFIRKAWAQARIAFCSPEHMQMKLARLT